METGLSWLNQPNQRALESRVIVRIREMWLRLKSERDSAQSAGGWKRGKRGEEGGHLQEQRVASEG